MTAIRVDALQMADGKPLQAVLGSSVSLGGRRGFRHHGIVQLRTFRYDHRSWMSTYRTLELPTCAEIRNRAALRAPVE